MGNKDGVLCETAIELFGRQSIYDKESLELALRSRVMSNE